MDGCVKFFECFSTAGNYRFKVNYRNTRTRCEICLQLTINFYVILCQSMVRHLYNFFYVSKLNCVVLSFLLLLKFLFKAWFPLKCLVALNLLQSTIELTFVSHVLNECDWYFVFSDSLCNVFNLYLKRKEILLTVARL